MIMFGQVIDSPDKYEKVEGYAIVYSQTYSFPISTDLLY